MTLEKALTVLKALACEVEAFLSASGRRVRMWVWSARSSEVGLCLCGRCQYVSRFSRTFCIITCVKTSFCSQPTTL